jgi:hypothetical protein
MNYTVPKSEVAKRPPGFKIPREKSNNFVDSTLRTKRNLPGPGKYEVNASWSVAQGKFKKARRKTSLEEAGI